VTEKQQALPLDQSSISSSLGEDFDAEALKLFIEESLSDTPELTERVHHDSLLSFGDTRLIEKLSTILEEHIKREQIVLVLDKLREELYAGTASSSIKDLHNIILNTKVKGDPGKAVMPSWNIKNPDVVFVGEKPPRWGDADSQFVDALKSVRFNSNLCAWTSVVRYWPTDGLDDDEERRWIDFLFSELRIWQPKLIIPLGGYATSVFLGSDAKMGDRQGVFHWLGPWAVLPLYSYSYCIQANKLDTFKQGLEQAHKFCFGDL
jgi:uracil-DNA glycosylase